MGRIKGQKERTKFEQERDRLTIMQSYLAGKTQAAIAEEMNLSPQTISREIGLLVEEWKKRYLGDWEASKVNELVKLDKLENTYWQAWESSKRVKRLPSAATDSDGNSLPTELETEEQDGDPRFLQGVERCVELRCRILGLFTPAPTINNNLIQVNNSENVAEKKVIFYLPEKDSDPRNEIVIQQ